MSPRATAADSARTVDRDRPAETSGTRRRVLDAAARVLARDGLDMSMESVAEMAGVTRMTVYRQLGPREQVLLAVLLDQSAQLSDGLRADLDADRPFADGLVDAMVRIVLAVRASPVLSFFVRSVTPSQVEHLGGGNEFVDRVSRLLLPYFERAEAEGVLRAPAAATLDWTLRQTLLQLVVEGAHTGTETGLRADLRTFFIPSVVRQ